MLAFSAGFPRAPGALLHFAALALRPQVADGKAAFLKKWRKVGRKAVKHPLHSSHLFAHMNSVLNFIRTFASTSLGLFGGYSHFWKNSL